MLRIYIIAKKKTLFKQGNQNWNGPAVRPGTRPMSAPFSPENCTALKPQRKQVKISVGLV
jgi:hypothetical protein